MQQSLATLNAAQTARMMTLPNQANARMPLREGLLEIYRQRNAVLDFLFYDLAKLHNHESAALAPRYAAEGAVLCVWPSDHAKVLLWPDYDSFRASGETGTAKALVVAGVGSSALGAAAFARNVADALDAPVLAVVSGYGLADVVTESLGGWFLFGALNSMRHWFEPMDMWTRSRKPSFSYSKAPSLDLAQTSLDVKTLIALLAGHDFDLIVGHSKGNLVISEALNAIAATDPDRAQAMAAAMKIITISARVWMPKPFRNIIDIMGENDPFGEMNSRKDIMIDIVMEGAAHHTNTDLPYHLDVTNAVARALKA